MDVSLINRMKELEAENQRLKTMYAESKMDAEILKEALAGKVLKPSQRLEMAKRIITERDVAISRACRLMCTSQTCFRYQAKLNRDHERIADRLV